MVMIELAQTSLLAFYLVGAAISLVIFVVYAPKPQITDPYGMESFWVLTFGLVIIWPLLIGYALYLSIRGKSCEG